MRFLHCGWIAALLAGVWGGAAAAADGKPGTGSGRDHTYAAVITGGELLRGVYADGHTQFLARALRPLGLRCVASVCVGDQAPDLLAALRFAAARAPLIIVTGGLGPTDDDITRETVSAFTGVPLRENPEVIARLRARYGRDGGVLPANLRRQARTPVDGDWLPNPHGSAVGLWFNAPDHLVVALPGPPRELHAIVREHLLPRLRKRLGLAPLGASRRLRFAGIGESRIDQTLHSLGVLPQGLEVSSIFEEGRVDLTLSLPGHEPADAARLDRLVAALRARIGDHVYATNEASLEDVILAGVKRRRGTLAVLEQGSGGALAVHLMRSKLAGGALAAARVQPANRGFPSNAGAASPSEPAEPQTVVAAARKAAQEAGASWALASGPLREGRTWVAFGPADGALASQPFSLRDTTAAVQGHFVTAVLEWVRHRLEDVPAGSASDIPTHQP